MAEPHPLPALATPKEVAAYLRKSPKTLANWRSQGIGPKPRKVGHSVLYRRRDVDAWLDRT
ncbi:DNA-binding protein [Actinomadura sp. KC216]|uniref:helix-turn-helix transcriptional regulator n=1 Tax=Actinomadura sp. KC216 TaxID=2530370 RepID=UPI0010527FEC|nr:helix-turn-helix domain-containing protein [Actinomadura sp. KC216]TDB86444.1 DNA-binding protein [Actinomadura sp. KC216]